MYVLVLFNYLWQINYCQCICMLHFKYLSLHIWRIFKGTLVRVFFDRKPISILKIRELSPSLVRTVTYGKNRQVVVLYIKIFYKLLTVRTNYFKSTVSHYTVCGHVDNFRNKKYRYILISAFSCARLWIEKANVLVDIETEISRNLKGLGAIEIANAVRKKSLAGVETAIRFFETQPHREREPDR
jgi:hypothetical protein